MAKEFVLMDNSRTTVLLFVFWFEPNIIRRTNSKAKSQKKRMK
eukprot:gene10050-7022_t